MMDFPSLKHCSAAELEEMAKAIKAEMDSREDERFRTLCKEACDALNALRLEFPWISFTVMHNCDVCGEATDVNLFEAVEVFTPSAFTR